MQSPYFLEWIVILLGKTHFSPLFIHFHVYFNPFFPIDSMDFVISLIFEGQCKLPKLIKYQIYTIIASNSFTSHFLKCVSLWKKTILCLNWKYLLQIPLTEKGSSFLQWKSGLIRGVPSIIGYNLVVLTKSMHLKSDLIRQGTL